MSAKSLVPAAVLERFQHLIMAEAADLLARRELLECLQELPDVLLSRHARQGGPWERALETATVA